MGSLSNLYISQSYTSLIHLGNDGPISDLLPGQFTDLEDGLGNSINISVNANGDISASGNIYGANITGSQIDTGSLVSVTSFNSYTSSTNIRLNNLENTSASVNVSISNLNSTTQSLSTSITNLNSTTASLNSSVSQLNATSASQQISINNLNSFSASTLTRLTNIESTTASLNASVSNLNTNSASVNNSITNLNSATSSLFGSASLALVTASFNNSTRNLTFTKGDSTQFSVNIPDVSGSAGDFVTTSSFNAYTSSNDQRVSSLESNSASVNISISNLNAATSSYANSASVAAVDAAQQQSIDALNAITASFLTSSIDITQLNAFTASQLDINSGYNSFTSSANQRLGSLEAATSSYVTESETASFARYDVSNPWSANQTFTNITAVSASFTYVQTTYETSSVIYSSGSNQFGDELTDIQTLSGSVKVQGSLTVNGTPVSTSSADISGLVTTASFNTYTASTDSDLASIHATTASLQEQLATIGTQSGSWVTESETGSFATTGSNSFTGTQTLGLGAIVPNGQDLVFEMLTGSISMRNNVGLNRLLFLDPISNQKYLYIDKDTAEVHVSGAFSAQLAEGYAWVGDSTGRSTQVATSSFSGTINTGSFATTGSNVFVGDQTIFKEEGKLAFQSGSSNTAHVKMTTVGNLELAVQNTQIGLLEQNAVTLQKNTTINGTTTANGTITTTGDVVIDRQQYKVFKSVFTSSLANDQFTGYLIEDQSGANGSGFVYNSYGELGPSATVLYGGGNNTAASQTILASSFSNGNVTFFKDTNFFIGNISVSGSTYINNLTASLQQGYVWVGDASGKTTTVATSSFGGGSTIDTGSFATTGSNTFVGNQIVNGTINSTGNITTTSDFVLDRQQYKVFKSVFTSSFAGDQYTGFIIEDQSGNNGSGFTYSSYGELGPEAISIYGGGNNTAASSTILAASFNDGNVTFFKDNNIFKGNVITSGSVNAVGALTASLQQGYVWVGDASGRTTTVSTSSFGGGGSAIDTGSFATTGSNAFFGNNSFSGTFAVSASAISILSGSSSGSVITNLTDTYTSVPSVNQIVTLPSASYAALVSGSLTDPNTLYVVSGSIDSAEIASLNAFTASQLTINSGYNTFTSSVVLLNANNNITGSQTISGSLNLIGSAYGNVVALSITSNTASMDLSKGNYFTLTLADTTTTHISASNVQPGLSATLVITTGTDSSASLAPTMLQPSGSTYVASNGSARKDVLSIVAVESGVPYVVSSKNMI